PAKGIPSPRDKAVSRSKGMRKTIASLTIIKGILTEGRGGIRNSDSIPKSEFRNLLRMLMTQFVAKLLNHGVHLVFELEFFLFQSDFFDVILFGQVMAAAQVG